MKAVILVLLILCGVVSLYGQDSDDQLQEVVFNTSWYPQAQFAGYFVAAKKGFYERRGIKAKFIFSTFDMGVQKNLTDGKADLGIMWLHEGLMAHDKNDKIINIAQFIDTSNILIVSRKKDIKSIGIWKPYLGFLKTYIHKAMSDSIEIVPLRDGNEAFIYGAVDAVTVMYYNEFNQLINSGIDTKDLYIHRLSDMGLLLPEDGVYCLRDYYEKNQKLCYDFIEASLEGWQYAFEHVDEAVQICFDYMKDANYYSNVTVQKLMLNTLKQITIEKKIGKNGYKLNKEAFNKMVKFLLKNGLIASEIKYEQFCEGGL